MNNIYTTRYTGLVHRETTGRLWVPLWCVEDPSARTKPLFCQPHLTDLALPLCVFRHPLQASPARAGPHRTHEHSHRTSRASSKIPHDLPAVLITTTPPSWARQHGARCFSFVKLPSSDLLSSSSGSCPLVREVSCRAHDPLVAPPTRTAWWPPQNLGHPCLSLRVHANTS